MSTAALATEALATTDALALTGLAPSPDVDGTRQARRRPRIAGTTTERLPVRACSGEELGRHVQARSARERTAAETEPPALRLTRRGQLLLTAVSVLVFGAAIAVLGLRIAGVLDAEPQFSRTIPVQVGAGQTLWSIAQETNPGVDPTVMVDKIADLNNLSNPSEVIPGRTLQVPVR